VKPIMSRFELNPAPSRWLPLALAAVMACQLGVAHADDRADLERVRATTNALIESLVESGLLPRDKANAILKQAAEAGDKAAATGVAAVAPASADAAAASPKAPVIRIPYISETVKAELREQVKQDVLAQAHNERWGDAGAMPDWLRRIHLDGDVRVRFQSELFDKANLAPDSSSGYATQTSSGANLGWAPDLTNTQHDRDRMTLRARMGLVSELGGGFTSGFRLSTGSTSGPASTSQTLGASFNKYSVVWDRAFVQYKDASSAEAVAGRFANPFFGTDLTWPDDLNFDGVAVAYKPALQAGNGLFMTAGAFPLREFETSNKDKWLYGGQVGGSFNLASYSQLRVGLALYKFAGIQGQAETTLPPSGDSVGVQPYLLTEYPTGVRQKGNTLFRINQYSTSGNTTWGLASKFTPINLTAELKLLSDYPVNVRLTADYVNNLGFDLAEIRRRTNLADNVPLAKQTQAFQLKATAGYDQPDKFGQWQGTLTFRRLERDAWVDAFTDTTWHLGGTNYQGWSLGGVYGLGHRTTAGVRWTSTRSLPDNTLYTTSTGTGVGLSGVPLKIDVLQLEVNSRF
jgi:hypothetical protein